MKRPNIILFSSVAIAFYAAGLIYFNSSGIFQSIKEFNTFYLAPVFLCIGLSYAFKYGRWHFFLRNAGIAVPAKKLFPIFVASLSMLITPGKVGDVLKSYLLKKKFGYPKRRTLPTVIMERVSDLPSLALLSVAGVYTVYPDTRLVVLPFAILAAFLFAVRSRAFFSGVISVNSRFARLKKHNQRISALYANMRIAASWKNIVVGGLIGMAGWIVEGLILYGLLLGLGVKVNVFLSISIYIISVIAGVISLIPGGLGASEASLFGLLALSGVSRPDALAATILFRALTLWMSLAAGSVALSYVERKKVW